MDYQLNTVEKTIRPVFTGPITYHYIVINHINCGN